MITRPKRRRAKIKALKEMNEIIVIAELLHVNVCAEGEIVSGLTRLKRIRKELLNDILKNYIKVSIKTIKPKNPAE